MIADNTTHEYDVRYSCIPCLE